MRGVTSGANAVLHPWLQGELSMILAELPPRELPGASILGLDPVANRAQWERWQAGLTQKFTLLDAAELPPLRLLLILDNLAGHKTPELVCWMMRQGIMPLYTPLGGSWLNMAESIQRILTQRALAGQHPQNPGEIITWLEATARAWNRTPTPFIWGGKRQARRARAHARRQGYSRLHHVGGSGAYTWHWGSAPKRKKTIKRERMQQRLCA